MFGKKKNVSQATVRIQTCQCGGINVCYGNVTVHMNQDEFIANAEKMEKAKKFILSTKPTVHEEVHHEIH